MTEHDERVDIVKDLIRDVPDFPKEGIVFKDIMPLLADPTGFRMAVQLISELFDGLDENDEPFDEPDVIVGMESRGFIFGAALAQKLGAAFVPVRKPGKLPCPTHKVEYALEYGTDALEIHVDAFPNGAKVLIVDDLIATGGTAKATEELVEKAGGTIIGSAFLIDLTFLKGTDKLSHRARAVLSY